MQGAECWGWYKGRNLLTGRDRDKFGWLTSNNCSITSCRTLYHSIGTIAVLFSDDLSVGFGEREGVCDDNDCGGSFLLEGTTVSKNSSGAVQTSTRLVVVVVVVVVVAQDDHH